MKLIKPYELKYTGPLCYNIKMKLISPYELQHEKMGDAMYIITNKKRVLKLSTLSSLWKLIHLSTEPLLTNIRAEIVPYSLEK
jgi:hypothetical protein